ncbi:hypothetical protein RJ640_003978 [Escallonia rubra]|uniref:SDE2/SF3A3 SAP domain-containing protein n=1 Tax=Escallonia rubra TaxID=112253 RepID=A0AA88S887_9ASTE|nr:hypothetical protein RJ640_003978 [Escallonia rubra]
MEAVLALGPCVTVAVSGVTAAGVRFCRAAFVQPQRGLVQAKHMKMARVITNTTAGMVLGMERLKSELQARGSKCGGTLQERAARLFLLKTTPCVTVAVSGVTAAGVGFCHAAFVRPQRGLGQAKHMKMARVITHTTAGMVPLEAIQY